MTTPTSAPQTDQVASVRALVADDHAVVRNGIRAMLAVVPDIKAGALGYHLKDSDPDELVQAIRQVCQGESSLHPIIARKVLQGLSHT